MEKTPALQVDHLNVNYDKVSVLWDISFSIPKGKLVAVLGPNGAGKSTLLKSLLGFVKPLSGKVSFLGKPLKKSSVAYVPQRNCVDWDFPITVFDVVLMGSYGRRGFLGFIKKEDKISAKKALAQVGLEEFAQRQISELSGGQQQRVFIARALVQKAEVYLMDEPFAAVDASTEKALIDILKKLTAEGKTVFVVHHDLLSVSLHFDHVLLLNGVLVSCGPTGEAFTQEHLEKAYGSSLPCLGV